MRKTTSGFTIVELLIVIVVIGILATVTVVAYNGIRTRAENNKTIAAAQAWYKAFKLYETDNGELPHTAYDSCLGEDYVWDYDGATSGTNQCRYATTSYYIKKINIQNVLKQYLGNGAVPTPSMQVIGGATNWSRGLLYIAPAVGGSFTLMMVIANESTCPTVAGQTAITSAVTGGVNCNYILGQRLR